MKTAGKKRRRRRATRVEPVITMRLPKTMKARVDNWAAGKGCSRSEAMRRLVERGLAQQPLPAGKPHKEAAKAKEMARAVIDNRLNGVPEGEKVVRKWRLLKKPVE